MSSPVFDLPRLRRSFFGVSGLYVLGIPLMLLANIVLARSLSVTEFGIFGFIISLATVLAIPVSGGLPMLLTREVATYNQQENWPAYRGLIVAAYRWVATIYGVIAVGLLGWSLTAREMLTGPLLIAFFLPLFLGLNGVRVGLLRGLGRPMLAEAPTQVLQPALMILGYLVLAWLGLSTAVNALWWYLCVVVAVFGVASLMLWRVQPRQVHVVTSDLGDLPRWRRAIFPFALLSATTLLSTQVAVLVSGLLGEKEAVAYLRVAERGAMIIILPFHILSAILGPHIVQAIRGGNVREQKLLSQHSSRLMFYSALPVGVTMLVGGGYILQLLFGSPYDQHAYLPMAILAITQVTAMSFGNVNMFLTMSGRELATFASQASALLVNIGVCLMLVADYGAVGAALGVSAGVITSTTITTVMVIRYLGFVPGIFGSKIRSRDALRR